MIAFLPRFLGSHLLFKVRKRKRRSGNSSWHLRQYQMKHSVGPPTLKTMLSSTSGHKNLSPSHRTLCNFHLSCALHNRPLCQGWRAWMSNPFSVLAGKLFYLFSEKPFCTWGIFSCLFWEVVSSFPKNLLHLLFKQGALWELWSLRGYGGVVKSFVCPFDSSRNAGWMQAEVSAFARSGMWRKTPWDARAGVFLNI